MNDGEENKYFVNCSGGTIYFLDDELRKNYFVTDGKENKYFVNKREVIITLLLDEFCE